MGEATSLVQRLYEAFGRGDVATLLSYVADDVEWELAVPAALAYGGRRTTRAQVAEFFAAIPRVDDIHQFEPREFIESADGNVTVLGWEKSTALDTGKDFETDWIHLFTVRDGKVTRWRGFFDTAARYGH